MPSGKIVRLINQQNKVETLENISIEEARLRFKIGHQFVVNDDIGKPIIGRHLKPGDVIRLRDFYTIGNDWGIKYNFVNKPDVDVFNQLLHSKFLEPIDSPAACQCNILLGPCHCGAFQREKETGFVATPPGKRTYF
jgi:hypothetical protein